MRQFCRGAARCTSVGSRHKDPRNRRQSGPGAWVTSQEGNHDVLSTSTRTSDHHPTPPHPRSTQPRRTGTASQPTPCQRPPGTPPPPHRGQRRRSTGGAALRPRGGGSPTGRGGCLVSGLKTGITIAVYAISCEGDRRVIKPPKHFDGEKLTAWDPTKYVYEPCRCKMCVPGGKVNGVRLNPLQDPWARCHRSRGTLPGKRRRHAPHMVRCELCLWHDGEHADLVWDWTDRPTHGLWARWVAEEPMRFESLPWCETSGGPHNQACGLYRDHVSEHSWDVFAPEIETIRRKVVAENPGWFNPPGA
jgi:hypothetical protein